MTPRPEEHPYPYFYRSRRAHPERYGTRCRMVGRTRGFTPAGTLVEFEDGARLVVSNMVLRRAR